MNFTLILFFIAISFSGFTQKLIKVACVGNSITQGFGHTHVNSYPTQLGLLLGDAYEVKNFGVSGRTLLSKGDFPYINEKEYQHSQHFNPDIVVILLGTNDSKDRNWAHGKDFKKDYTVLITVYENLPSKPTIYLGLALPVFKPLDTISETVVKNEINPIIVELATEFELEIIDFYSAFANKSELIPDGVHPDKKGYYLMATVTANVVGK